MQRPLSSSYYFFVSKRSKNCVNFIQPFSSTHCSECRNCLVCCNDHSSTLTCSWHLTDLDGLGRAAVCSYNGLKVGKFGFRSHPGFLCLYHPSSCGSCWQRSTVESDLDHIVAPNCVSSTQYPGQLSFIKHWRKDPLCSNCVLVGRVMFGGLDLKIRGVILPPTCHLQKTCGMPFCSCPPAGG